MSQSHYKLSYFDVRALAEPARIILNLNNVQFEDHRVTVDEWPEFKKTTPFGQIPVLEVDGVKIGQSVAIARYLGKKFGLAGKTLEEEAQADAIVDLYKDFVQFFKQFTSRVFYGVSEEEIKTVSTTVIAPAAVDYLANLNKVLENNKSGYLVGDSLTWADIVIADNLTSLIKNGFVDVEKEHLLAAFHKKVHETAGIKEYVQRRKDTRV